HFSITAFSGGRTHRIATACSTRSSHPRAVAPWGTRVHLAQSSRLRRTGRTCASTWVTRPPRRVSGGCTTPSMRQPRYLRGVHNANVAAATLFTGGTNGGWTRLSSSANGTPGFASFNYCSTQCTYDMPVFSPPGSPSIVYIGSSMQYGELGGRSNGRAIQRSEDAGANFTDMTI